MRKWMALFVFLPRLVLAGGPKYTYPSPPAPQGLDDEMQNIYHNISYPNINYATISSETVTTSSITNLNVTGSYKGITPGKFIQFASSTTVVPTATTSNIAISTLLSVTLTPKSLSDHMLIFVSGGLSNSVSTNVAKLKVSSPNLGNPGQNCANWQPPSSATARAPASCVIDDGPVNQTTPYTINVQIANNDNVDSVSFGSGAGENLWLIVVEVSP